MTLLLIGFVVGAPVGFFVAALAAAAARADAEMERLRPEKPGAVVARVRTGGITAGDIVARRRGNGFLQL